MLLQTWAWPGCMSSASAPSIISNRHRSRSRSKASMPVRGAAEPRLASPCRRPAADGRGSAAGRPKERVRSVAAGRQPPPKKRAMKERKVNEQSKREKKWGRDKLGCLVRQSHTLALPPFHIPCPSPDATLHTAAILSLAPHNPALGRNNSDRDVKQRSRPIFFF